MTILDVGVLHDARRLRGFVWWCGDDYCDCTQATIEADDGLNPIYRCWRLNIRSLWQGEFHTNGEGGAHGDLGLIRLYLTEREPELAARIHWPSPEQGA